MYLFSAYAHHYGFFYVCACVYDLYIMCVCACLFFVFCFFFYVINLSLGGYTLLTLQKKKKNSVIQNMHYEKLNLLSKF